jgi:hypothetical protein
MTVFNEGCVNILGSGQDSVTINHDEALEPMPLSRKLAESFIREHSEDLTEHEAHVIEVMINEGHVFHYLFVQTDGDVYRRRGDNLILFQNSTLALQVATSLRIIASKSGERYQWHVYELINSTCGHKEWPVRGFSRHIMAILRSVGD